MFTEMGFVSQMELDTYLRSSPKLRLENWDTHMLARFKLDLLEQRVS